MKHKFFALLLCVLIPMQAFSAYADANDTENTAAEEQPSYWAQNEVDEAVGFGIVTPKFQSDYTAPITREEFCELIVNTLRVQNAELPGCADTAGLNFADTNNDDVKLASALGIVAGVGDNKFNPDGKITRQEAARMLYQAATVAERVPAAEKYFDYRFIDNNKKLDAPNLFDDIAKFEYWSSVGIQYCYQNGIMFGVGQNNFDPLGNYTREQAYLTVLRLYKKYNGEGIASVGEYNYNTGKFIYGTVEREFDKVYTPYGDAAVVFDNGRYSLVDKNGDSIIDDIGQNIEIINMPDTYVYDCCGDWMIIMLPLYSRTDGLIYQYRAVLCKADGSELWTMPNLHFTTAGDVMCISEADNSDGDNITKTLYTVLERKQYGRDDYSAKQISVYKK